MFRKDLSLLLSKGGCGERTFEGSDYFGRWKVQGCFLVFTLRFFGTFADFIGGWSKNLVFVVIDYKLF